MKVEIEEVNMSGEIIAIHEATLSCVHGNFAYIEPCESTYCLADEECAGYFCCGIEKEMGNSTQHRLSTKSLKDCRALRK